MPSVGTMTLDASSLLRAHPALVQELAGHALAHVLYAQVRRVVGRRGLSRREIRKISNRKRRRFVDNIIMHHKRLHDKNRQSIISNARSRALARKNQVKKDTALMSSRTPESKAPDMRSKYSSTVKERGERLRGRVDARRLRARSRWLTVMQTNA